MQQEPTHATIHLGTIITTGKFDSYDGIRPSRFSTIFDQHANEHKTFLTDG